MMHKDLLHAFIYKKKKNSTSRNGSCIDWLLLEGNLCYKSLTIPYKNIEKEVTCGQIVSFHLRNLIDHQDMRLETATLVYILQPTFSDPCLCCSVADDLKKKKET